MNLLKFKPTTPGLRNKIKLVFKNLNSDNKTLKKLSKNIIYKSGRNNHGHITIRHRGGMLKRRYRFIDFYRNKYYISGRIKSIEYDPFRSSSISLVSYDDGDKRYIITPKGIKIGDIVISGENVPLKLGNTLTLRNIPIGIKIHCLEIKPNKGFQLSRSAGSYSSIVSKDLNHVIVSLKSGILRKFDPNCKATIGQVSNDEHFLTKLGKAGCKRLKGIRPTVRGVAMNPVDHPHGGGEGKTSGGRDPVSPWGKFAKYLKKN